MLTFLLSASVNNSSHVLSFNLSGCLGGQLFSSSLFGLTGIGVLPEASKPIQQMISPEPVCSTSFRRSVKYSSASTNASTQEFLYTGLIPLAKSFENHSSPLITAFRFLDHTLLPRALPGL